ncbi:hypothetical protein ACFE04_010992 [Oxalis oulophora]
MGIACSLPVECMATRCWDVCIGDHRVKYVRDLQKNLESLQTLLSELSAQRADILYKVEAAEQCQGLKRLQIVDKWLNDVTTAESEAGNLIQDSPKQIQKLCFGGCCSKNCILSYKFGKKVDQQLNVVRDLLGKPEKEDFKVLIGTQRLEQVELIPMRPPVGLDSTFDRAWSCIQNEKVETIGIYGPGGVGKTTLLKQINNRLSETDFFVIWVVVSKGCNREKLQEDIGKSLRISNDDHWKMKRYDEKAIDIFKILKQKKFALLLDDMWEFVDLAEMGIPSQMRANESKIVLTSRSIQVCGLMRANEKIMVEYLADANAFKLFCETVGKDTLASNPKIPKLAKIVAKECDGLPLALITVARAMIAKQTPEEWDLAIEILRSYAAEFPDMTEKVYSCLKFSYDNLPNEMVRSCFLYCCLFREDMIIKKSELIEYWICEGFLGEKNIKCNRNLGFDIIGTLLSACLVEKYHYKYIKMHDVTREMALWISQEFEKDKHGSFVSAGMLMKVPRVEEWEGKRRVSLMHNEIKQLQEAPSCSHLITLFMNNNKLEMITGQFFQGMPFLVVLNLSYNEGLRELPSEISKLVYLEYLNLSYTGLQKLPIGLNALIRLKYLNLESKRHLKIQCNVISNFQKLQTLNLQRPSLMTEDAGMFFEELRSLRHLETLDIFIDTRVAYHEFQSSNTLHSCIKNLIFSKVEVRVSILANMEHLESLRIHECDIIVDKWDTKRVKEDGGETKFETSMNVVHSMTLGKRLDRLQYVSIEFCSGADHLSWLILAPNLTHIHVSFCYDIIEVINMGNLGKSENLNLFAKLVTLELLDLINLQSICKYALSFPRLKTLWMRGCGKLKKLPINSSTSKDIKFLLGAAGKEWWDKLEWEDEATRIASSNRLKYEGE